MNKLSALFVLFRAGGVVADPALWKQRGNNLQLAIVGFLMAVTGVANAFGHPLPIDEATAGKLAAGLCALLHVVFTVITTDKIGLPFLRPHADAAADATPPAVAGAPGNLAAPSPGPSAAAPAGRPAQPDASDPLQPGPAPAEEPGVDLRGGP